MRARALGLLAVAALVLAATAWWLVDRDIAGNEAAPGLALPGFAARVEAIDRIEVLGAGAVSLLVLEKTDGLWRMPGKQDWPANQREIGKALFSLGQAQRLQAKTANPALHARLGVEDIAGAQAKGSQLRLSGGGEPVQLTIGNNHPSLGGSYVRFGDEAQAWLLDVDISPARDPVDWLDRRLLDVPMARIESISVTPARGRTFTLSRVDDVFSLDGLPPAAMHSPDAGNTTAGFTDQLPFDDLGADAGSAAEQTVEFEGVDGLRFTVEAWRGERGTWARLAVALDEAKAKQWIARADARAAERAAARAAAEAAAEADDGSASGAAAGDGTADDAGDSAAGDAVGPGDAPAADIAAETRTPAERLQALRAQVAEWQARFQGRQFLLPPYKAEGLLRTRADYLADAR